MANYRYRAMTNAGAVVTGHLNAPSEMLAVEQIRKLGLYPIAAAPAIGAGWRAVRLLLAPSGARVSTRTLAIATQEIATLLNAGLELDRVLESVADLGETRRLREPILAAVASVKNGVDLADALSDAKAFPKLYVSMVRAAEASGNLVPGLKHLADYLARADAIKQAVVSALIYPVILLTAAVLSVIFILVFVLPEFQAMFAESGKKLPLATQMIIGAGDFIRNDWWILAGVALGATITARHALRRDDVRSWIDGQFLRLPFFGDLVLKIEVERLCRTMATLLGNGVGLPSALAIAGDMASNRVIARALADTTLSLKEGEGLAGLLARAKVFPQMTVDLIRVGELSSKLDEMLAHQADLYERSIRHTTERLLAMLVPALTVLLGALVAGLVGSILSAILSVNDLAT